MDGAAATKEKLERAALHLFLRQGVDGTSMREIVNHAGYSLGAFYNHFASKEELAERLFLDTWYTMGAEIRRRTRGETDLFQQLFAVTDYMFDFYESDPNLVGYAFLSRHRFILKVNVRQPNPHLVIRLIITAVMTRGEARKMDIEIATQIVMGAIIQAVDARLLGLIKGSLASRSREVADSLHRMLKA
jgi:AcrR family transcriptional regulator